MPRTHTYGILNLFALVEKLLAPFVDPLRAEFEAKAMDCQRPSTPPAEVTPTPEEPTAVPAADPTPEVPVSVPVVVHSVVPVADLTNSNESSGPQKPPPASSEPLFVRIGSGRGARYRLDDGHTPGDRFRRRVKNGRLKYEPAR